MVARIAQELEWDSLKAELRRVTPEVFGGYGDVTNLVAGKWDGAGRPREYRTPVDGRALGALPMLDRSAAVTAVEAARREADTWGAVPLAERRARVKQCLGDLAAHRDLLARLLVWEIGKSFKTALADVDRCISGVAWYETEIEAMLEGRAPLGLVSNIASWNYPLSVLWHAVLVQALAGNAVVAKTPTDGGLYALTLSAALARRAGLPVSLVSGGGAEIGDVLVEHAAVDALAYVGGKANGRAIAQRLAGKKRAMLEMEGINCWGIWGFSDWDRLCAQIKKGYEYGKQRCTAYARFVVERRLFPRFLETYVAAVSGLRVGNPTLAARGGEELCDVDFGPLIRPSVVQMLNERIAEAERRGAVVLYRGRLDDARFLPGQDASAYFAPTAVLGVPRNTDLYHHEPFGPVDVFVVVDSLAELVTEMNVSNGCLVASMASDDIDAARALALEIRAFKIGINELRSRGDRAEVFGGFGSSWTGCFVGGKYLVDAVTSGPPGAPLYGNFGDASLLPELR